jgi:hypothetical protein
VTAAPAFDKRRGTGSTPSGTGGSAPCAIEGVAAIEEGKQTLRYDTFGDEAFWGDTLKLHQAIEGATNGGGGPGVSPLAALGLGLKVDADALPDVVLSGITRGSLNL